MATASTARSTPKLQPRSKEAIYVQVKQHIRDWIDRGDFPPGSQLPGTRELQERFGGINHLTVRQAVRELAAEGYVEAVQGRGTFVKDCRRATGRIALVLTNLEDALTVQIAKGVQRAMESLSKQVLILDSRRDPGVEVDHLEALSELPVDGAIIYPVRHSRVTEAVFRLKVQNYPFVLIDVAVDGLDAPCVTVDHEQAGYLVTQHLTRRGCRRLAWVGERGFSSADARYRGFREALNDGGLLLDRSLDRSVAPERVLGPYEDVVRKQVAELIQSPEPPDGIVFGNDLFALVGLNELKAKGVSVPGEIAVVGMDNCPESEWCSPALTTARRPMERQGERAGHMLIDRIKDLDSPADTVVLPVELVVRDSA